MRFDDIIMSMASPLDEQLCDLTQIVSADIVAKLGTLGPETKIPSYNSFINLSGEGSERVKTTSSRPRYQALFSVDGSNELRWLYADVEGFEELFEFVIATDRYRDFITPTFSEPTDKIDEDLSRRMQVFSVFDLACETASRHFVLDGRTFDATRWLKYYLEMERWWRNEDLKVNIVIPILGTNIDAEVVGSEITFSSLSTDLLAAAWPSTATATTEDNTLLLRATDALVIPNVAVDVQAIWGLRSGTRLQKSFMPQVQFGLEALAVVAEEPFGLAHCIYECLGWSSGYRHDLPSAEEGPKLPTSRITNLSVDQAAQKLKAADLQLVVDAFDSGNPRLRLASRRLFMGRSRPEKVDRIIDYAIGLEAIAGDTETTETTYKLALRLATLLTAARKVRDTRLIFRCIKKAYSYRSKIAHGSHTAEKAYMITLEDGSKIASTSFLRWILTWTLQAISEDPTLMGRISNDELLFEIIERERDK